jgi:hypothetical protein
VAFHFQHEWYPLVGQQVVVRLRGNVVRHGTVDAVTKDDEVLWLDLEGTAPRQLFERSEGFEVWIDYKWETGGQTNCSMSRTVSPA